MNTPTELFLCLCVGVLAVYIFICCGDNGDDSSGRAVAT